MDRNIISEQDKEALLELIATGEMRVGIKFKSWDIEFDLASAGAEGAAEVDVMRANGGIYNEGLRVVAILTANIVKIGSLNLANIPFGQRFREIGKLQPQMREFLWGAYNQLRRAQDMKFAALMEDSKKSLESQLIAITGDSTKQAE